MRTVYVMTADYKVRSFYDVKEFHRALEDVTANGFAPIDIKFDADGDIVLFVADKSII